MNFKLVQLPALVHRLSAYYIWLLQNNNVGIKWDSKMGIHTRTHTHIMWTSGAEVNWKSNYNVGDEPKQAATARSDHRAVAPSWASLNPPPSKLTTMTLRSSTGGCSRFKSKVESMPVVRQTPHGFRQWFLCFYLFLRILLTFVIYSMCKFAICSVCHVS